MHQLCRFALSLAIFSLGLTLGGCSSSEGSPIDSGISDIAIKGDLGASPDALLDPLAAAVRELLPYVAPNAPDDLTKTIGAVVAAVTPADRRVFGFGATKAHGAQLPDGDTVFQIGSISKVFTGLALARLVAEGTATLKLDDPVNLHLAADIQAPSSITLGQLVSHYSGLPEYPTNMVDRDGDGIPDPGTDPQSPAKDYSRANLSNFLADYTPTQPPGTSYAYSNAGIGVLAVALADTQQQGDYHTLLTKLVTQDLGMSQTWGENGYLDAEPNWLARLIQGYATQGGKRVIGKRGDMGVLAGAGEICTTGNDMLRFLDVLLGRSKGPLDAAVQTALTPLASMPNGDKVGYAFEIETSGGTTLYKKAGNTSSYSAYLLFDRDRGIGVVVMVNVGGFKTVKDIARAVYDTLASGN